MAIVDGSLQLGYKDSAWFTANASLVLLVGQIVYLEQTGTYKLGDGVTALSALSFLGGNSYTLTASEIGSVINGAASATPNDTDLVMSVESSVAKKNTWTQIKAFLKTYFDTLFVKKGTLTTNYIPKATASDTIGDSQIYDDGTNVGIGTTSVSAKLQVTGIDSTSSNYALKVDSSASSQLLYVRNDGNVGVCITPTYKLDVSSNLYNAFRVNSTGTFNSSIISSDQYSASLNINASTGTPIGGINTGIYLNSSNVKRGSFNSESTTGVTTLESAGGYWLLLRNVSTESIGLGQGGNYICFNTNTITNMLVDGSTGNVSIGTSLPTPTARLHIKGVDATSSNYALKVDNSTNSPLLYVRNDGIVNIGGLTPSQIVATDASKNLQSLSTATYPSLTELSYIKGLTSAAQTQLDSKSFLIQLLTAATFNPADATSYYFGINLVGYSVLTSQGYRRCYINRTGTITAASIVAARAGGVVTSEKSTFNIHINGGGANQITNNFDFSPSTAEFLNVTGLSINVTAGDYIEIGMVTPTWAINPTTVSINVQLTIK